MTDKILLVSPFPPPIGGIASWAVSMTNSDFGRQWQLVPFRTNFNHHSVYHHLTPKRNLPYEIKRCFRIWRGISRKLKEDNTIKIVHINIPANFTSMLRECITVLLVRKQNRKSVIHFHCTLPQTVVKKHKKMLFKLLMKLSQNVFVLNGKSYDFVRENTKSKVFLIPNFVENKMIRYEDKIIRPNIRTTLFVGGIIDKKGCRTIMETAKLCPDIQFRMVGYISEEYKNRTFPPNIIMTGEKSGKELQKEFEQADIFLFLSYMESEGFSVALTEAMAYGLPCIVTDWAANGDMIGKEGGIIVPIMSAEAVQKAIAVMQDREFRKNASQRNVKTVKENYSQQTVPKMFADAYTKICQ